MLSGAGGRGLYIVTPEGDRSFFFHHQEGGLVGWGIVKEVKDYDFINADYHTLVTFLYAISASDRFQIIEKIDEKRVADFSTKSAKTAARIFENCITRSRLF